MLAMVVGHSEVGRGRHFIWLIDNTVALSSVIKGSSSEPDLARGAAALHVAMAHIGVQFLFGELNPMPTAQMSPRESYGAARSYADTPYLDVQAKF